MKVNFQTVFAVNGDKPTTTDCNTVRGNTA